MQQRLETGKSIFRLWLNWAWSSGMLSFLILISLWLPAIYMPFAAFGLQLVTFLLIRRNRARKMPVCYIFPFVVSRVLFWSGVVMVVINLLYSHHFVHFVFDASQINPAIPFLTVLIIGPVSVLVSWWTIKNQRHLSFCRDCRMRSGTAAERGFLGVIFSRESRYQINVNLILSAIITVITWTYYFVWYSNDSISRHDLYVCFMLETFTWLAMTIYLIMRYIGIWEYYRQNIEGSAERHGRSTLIRFIIVYDKYICVAPPASGADAPELGKMFYDTPESVYYSPHESVSVAQAQDYFYNLTDIPGMKIRSFYKNQTGNADCNIFHFFAFPTDDQKRTIDRLFPSCEWMTFNDIAGLINEHKLFPLMSAEMTRLYDMVMAWKTFDRNGRRRYKIKNYRPTFHIEELSGWDIDFNDPTWLYVADNNEDTGFYRFRRFWRKYINGVGNYVEELNEENDSDNQ